MQRKIRVAWLHPAFGDNNIALFTGTTPYRFEGGFGITFGLFGFGLLIEYWHGTQT